MYLKKNKKKKKTKEIIRKIFKNAAEKYKKKTTIFKI